MFKCQKIYTLKGQNTGGDRSSGYTEARDSNASSVRWKRIPSNISASAVKAGLPFNSSSFKNYDYEGE